MPPQPTTAPTPDRQVARLKARLLALSRGDTELRAILASLSELWLAESAIRNPQSAVEYPVLSAARERAIRRLESPFSEDLERGADCAALAEIEDRALLDSVLSRAGLTRDERACWVLFGSVPVAVIGSALGISKRTVGSRRAEAERKLRSRGKIGR